MSILEGCMQVWIVNVCLLSFTIKFVKQQDLEDQLRKNVLGNTAKNISVSTSSYGGDFAICSYFIKC